MISKIKTFVSTTFTVVGLLGIVSFCDASTIFSDNFNSYIVDTGLNGQGGWVASSRVKVRSTPVKEGTATAEMLDFFNTGENATKSGAMLGDGQVTFYLRRHIGGTTNPSFKIFLKEGANNRIELRTGGLNFRYWNGSSYVNFGPLFSSDTWYSVQIQWRSSDHMARYNVDGGAWTEWATTLSAWSSGVDTIDITGTGGLMYFDAIQENLIGSEKTPVLIVPGLMGTELKKGDELLWVNVPKMIFSISDDFMDVLAFNEDLASIDENIIENNVIRREPFFDYTDGLINEFKNQGYEEEETLFTFPYDWRYGVSGKFADGTTVVDLLAQKINDILAETGSDKVDVISHSLGGLVVKKYVMEHPTTHHIDKAVFVGVPNTGAPEAIKTLLEGDNMGISWLSQKEIKKIAENLPVAYDLLPSRKYYDIKGSFVKVIDLRNFSLSNPEVTVTDLNYSQFEDYLANDHGLNSAGFNGSENLHLQTFDDFDLRTTGVDLYAIDGCKEPTITDIIETRSKNILGFETTNYNIKFGVGDGTVPFESVTNLPINQENKYYSLVSDHSKMLSSDGIRQKIVGILSGGDISVPDGKITQDISKCNLNGNVISVFSPIDISVFDQGGNYLGLTEDESIANEIPGANLEILGEHKFLYLPTNNGQTYSINIKGTGDGTFTIKNQKIAGNEITETEVFSNLPVTDELTGQINLGQTTTLIIQQSASSDPETILPSSIVDSNQSEDFLSPISGVEIVGTMGQEGFYRSNVEVNIETIDQISGVLSLHYNVDGSGYQTMEGNEVSIELLDEGEHSISFFATDKAGNNEPQRAISFTIDKTSPIVTIITPADGDSYLQSSLVNANWLVIDSLSGLNGYPIATIANGNPIDTSITGYFAFTVLATDMAGNTANITNNYIVFNYIFGNLTKPITLNTKDFKQTSTIPIKFQLFNNITGLPTQGPPLTLNVNGNPAQSSGGANTGNQFRYDIINQQYVYSLSAKSLNIGVNNLSVDVPGVGVFSNTVTIK